MIQETLEEVAKSHAIYELENNYKPTKESFKLACKRNFIRGAKWQQEQEKITTDDAYNEGFENGKHSQQERSYSEEEVLKLLISKEENTKDSTKYNGVEYITPEEWFEQFKK